MIIGIDIGTTHCRAAAWKNGAATLIPNASGVYDTPSCVSVEQDMAVLVGETARQRSLTHPQFTACAFKRFLGTDTTFRLGGHCFRAEALTALMLRSLKDDAEAWSGEPVQDVVLTVPACFTQAQRHATCRAGEMAGLNVERLLNEPSAAALAHGLYHPHGKANWLVIDVGASRCEVSVLGLFDGVMEVRTTAGDVRLGGNQLAALVIDLFFRESGVAASARGDLALRRVVAAHTEVLLDTLSHAASARLSVTWQGRLYEVHIPRERLRVLADPLAQRLLMLVARTLSDAGLSAHHIDNLVLAGGASRSPVVRRLLTRVCGRFPCVALDPDYAVALGAGVLAGQIMGVDKLADVAVTDVCPYTLGVQSAGACEDTDPDPGAFMPLISRNTVIPASRVMRYTPRHAGQRTLVLNVYQGEGHTVQDNTRLGCLAVPLPPCPPAQARVDVRFTYNVNGMLEIEATVPATRQSYRLRLPHRPRTDPPYCLPEPPRRAIRGRPHVRPPGLRPWFFDHLAIAPTHDPNRIRHAYAAALKGIDLFGQRAAFETLRRAYEQAVAWVDQPRVEVLPDEWDDDEPNIVPSSRLVQLPQ